MKYADKLMSSHLKGIEMGIERVSRELMDRFGEFKEVVLHISLSDCDYEETEIVYLIRSRWSYGVKYGMSQLMKWFREH